MDGVIEQARTRTGLTDFGEDSFAEGLQVQLVLDAVERSAANNSGWTSVDK